MSRISVVIPAQNEEEPFAMWMEVGRRYTLHFGHLPRVAEEIEEAIQYLRIHQLSTRR